MVRRLWGLLLAICVSCAAPTVPLPPPERPTISASGKPGVIVMSSQRGALPDAIIVIYNPRAALNQRISGAQADAEGSWMAEVVAQTGDVLDITQEVAGTRSVPQTVHVR